MSIDMDARTQVLLCAGGDAQRRVALHSLDPEIGFLAPRYHVYTSYGFADAVSCASFWSNVSTSDRSCSKLFRHG